jgi:hypothetical protein
MNYHYNYNKVHVNYEGEGKKRLDSKEGDESRQRGRIRKADAT